MPTETSTAAASAGATVALLPIGAHEQHGGHLPLATDSMIAFIVASALAEEYGARLLPTITVGCSHEHSGFAGTVSLSPATLIAVIDDIRASIQSEGVEKLVIVNAHGGNYVLGNIVQQANAEVPGSMALFPMPFDWAAAREKAGLMTDNHTDMHGGELETSILLHALPHVVSDNYAEADYEQPDLRGLLTDGMAALTPTGVIGRPSLATAEKGEAVVQAVVGLFDRLGDDWGDRSIH